MRYKIESDVIANAGGYRGYAHTYYIEALSELDAVIKASRDAAEDEEYISCPIEPSGLGYCVGNAVAYRNDDGSYEYHLYDDEVLDLAFTI